MHAGSLQTSSRMMDTLSVLKDGREHSTLAIGNLTGSVAVHSDIAALRENGIDIRHFRKGRIHFYQLAPKPQAAPQPPAAVVVGEVKPA